MLVWYLSPLNSSMARVDYFHDADSYSSSLNSDMAEFNPLLLKTLFQSYSHSVLLSHLHQKKSYSLITLTFSISLSFSQSRYHLTLTLPHALNLSLSLALALYSPSCSRSVLSLLVYIFSLESQGMSPYLNICLSIGGVRVIYGYMSVFVV